MAIVSTWDGENRRIYLHPDTVDITWNAIDLYREYRIHRRDVEAFRVWEPLLRMEGNVAKGGGKATPRYITLLDGAKIVPYDQAGYTAITGEIITDDQSSPYDYTSLANPMIVQPSPADAEIVYVEIESPLQDRLDYAGVVYIDTENGTAGAAYPYGTVAQPVNNYADAIALSAEFSLHSAILTGTFTLTGSQSLESYHLRGLQPLESAVILGGASTYRSRFDYLILSGICNGAIYVRDCDLGDLDNFAGKIIESSLTGELKIDPDYTGIITINRSTSGVAGSGSPVIDMNGSTADLQVRDYNGGLLLKNFNMGGNASFDINSGKVRLDQSCTSGTIVIRGDGQLIDHDTGDSIGSGLWNGVTIISNVSGGLTDEDLAAILAGEAINDEISLSAEVPTNNITAQVGSAYAGTLYKAPQTANSQNPVDGFYSGNKIEGVVCQLR